MYSIGSIKSPNALKRSFKLTSLLIIHFYSNSYSIIVWIYTFYTWRLCCRSFQITHVSIYGIFGCFFPLAICRCVAPKNWLVSEVEVEVCMSVSFSALFNIYTYASFSFSFSPPSLPSTQILFVPGLTTTNYMFR